MKMLIIENQTHSEELWVRFFFLFLLRLLQSLICVIINNIRENKHKTEKIEIKNRTVLTTKTRENGKIFKSIEGRGRRGRNHCGVINRGGAYREIQGKKSSPSNYN